MRLQKILALCLTVVLSFSILAPAVPAQVQASYLDYLTFDLCVDGLTVISCKKDISGPLELPAYLYLRGDPNPIPVVEVGNDVFEDCTGLTSVSFGENIKRIGDYAFWGCTGLKTVSISTGVNSIGRKAFGGCSQLESFSVAAGNASYSSDSRGVLFNKAKTQLVQAPAKLSGSYTIPNTVDTIVAGAFIGCSAMTSLTVPEGVSLLDFYLLSDCSALTEIHLPGTLTLIDEGAFSGCTSLKTVYFNGSRTKWNSIFKRSDNDPLENATIVFPTITGDLDSSGDVTLDDAIYLLQHTLMPGLFPITQAADYTDDSVVSIDDAIYLLQHVLMPDQFPL